MMGSPHLLAGAAIGATARRPWLAYPLAFASHFALDMVPHYDSSEMPAPVGGNPITEGGVAVADFALAWWLIVVLSRGQSWRTVAMWSAFFAIAIDLVFNLPVWGPVLHAWPPTAGVAAWHLGIQPHLPLGNWLVGFGPQVLVIALAAWVLRRQARADVVAQEKEPPASARGCR